MFWIRLKAWLMAAALLGSLGARAADIDLFAGSAPTGTSTPDVLFIIDTGASFSASNTSFRCNISSTGEVRTDGSGATADFTGLDKSNGGVEQCALYSVFKSLAAGSTTFNVGVMMFNSPMATFDPATNTFSNPCGASGISGGGCLVLPMTTLNATSAPNILSWIKGWVSSGNSNYNIKAPANMGNGATMQEAWAYYNGKVGMSGRDYATIKPESSACAAKNIIYLGNNYAQQATPKDSTSPADSNPMNALLGLTTTTGKRANPAATSTETAAVQAVLDTICTPSDTTSTLDTSVGNGASALNWALYMRNHGITTYSVALENAGCDLNYGVWLQKLGATEVGGGQFFSANDYAGMVLALKSALGSIAAVNSVFASVSLPVSVNTQGTYLNQIYVGMFRPAGNFLPRWPGNLKQYKLGLNSSGVLKLEDADGSLAINTLTGFITECARSYWTPNSLDTYWTPQQSGGCLAIQGSQASNYPDGNIVEKGAQAYRLRGITPSVRTVKTCSSTFASCTSLTDFSTTNTAVVTALGSSGLVNWVRGSNVDSELGMATSGMRPSAHGDVVHSRPIAINYGSDSSPSIVVYYGANDGILRAVNGNRGSATSSTAGDITSGGVTYHAGDEIWSFIPPESYGIVSRLRSDSPAISTPATNSNLSTQKQYGVDGPVTAFQGTVSGVSKVYIFSTMRRGGRVIYAFDVTTPAAPTLLWKKGCPNLSNDTDCSTDYSGIGQTWSSLKTMYAAGYGAGTSPLLIFGGGYDGCEDYDELLAGGANNNCSTTKGNKVFVVDAANGTVVKSFNTDRGVIADSTLVRDATTGATKLAYTADLGGNVYRITFGTGDVSTWAITKVAAVGCNTTAACAANRKFMFAPSVVTTDNDTYYLALGSGDREKPLTSFTAATAVTNYFFMIRDQLSAGATWYQDTANCGSGATAMCLNSLLPITTTTPTTTDLATKPKGWYLALASTEQVVTQAVTVFGVVTFSTHQPAGPPPPNMCKPNLGVTNVYNISYLDASGVGNSSTSSTSTSSSSSGTSSGGDVRFEHVVGDGLPPSPVAGQVTLDNGRTVPFCIGCSKDSPLEGAPPKSLVTVTQPTGRLYRYIKK
jgi:type IV pilus assembly protein PilY1